MSSRACLVTLSMFLILMIWLMVAATFWREESVWPMSHAGCYCAGSTLSSALAGVSLAVGFSFVVLTLWALLVVVAAVAARVAYIFLPGGHILAGAGISPLDGGVDIFGMVGFSFVCVL